MATAPVDTLPRESRDQDFVPHLRRRIGALEAARRHWLLVLIPTLLLLGAGIALALNRPPVYTAETRLTVGRIDVSAPGALGSFAVAADKLAAQYSRTIDAEQVTSRVASRTGLRPLVVSARVSATPIPESPVVRVIATGNSTADAARLANLAADALLTYTTELNRSNPDSARLLRRFRAQTGRYERLRSELQSARERYASDPSSSNLEDVQQTRVQLDVTQLRLDTVRTAYDASTRSQASTVLMQVLQRATTAVSDRDRQLQLLGFIGLIAGLSLGLALATLRANRRSIA